MNIDYYIREIAELVNMDCTKVSKSGKASVVRAFADTLCVSFPAIKEPGYKAACSYADTLSEGSVPVPALSHKLDVQPAALLWGILSHSIDFDDSCPNLCGHPSVVLFSTIAPLAAHYNKSGKDAIEAYICGYEAVNRFSIGVSSPQYDKGWHTTTTIGIFGAVIAASRLLGLTIDQTINALGIGASAACGLQSNFGTMTKTLHPGMTASNAICAVELARRGFTSSPDVFKSKFSYFSVYGGDLISIGKDRIFTNEGIIVKFYPSCGCTTRSNDLALILREKYKLDPDDVEKITLRISTLTDNCLRYVDPNNGTEAKFCLEYCFTKCLLDGPVKIDDFKDDFVLKTKDNDTFKKITSVIHREIPSDLGQGVPFAEEYLEAEIVLKNNEVITIRSGAPKGFPENPLTEAEFASKFQDCVGSFLSKKEADALLVRMMSIENEKNLSDLMHHFTKLMHE